MGSESSAEEIRRFEEQYRQQPDSLVFARLADAYRKAGQPDQALAVLEEGLARHPDYPSGHIVRARALRDLGRMDETLESFRRVLELDGANLVAIRELAGLAEERGDVEESLHWYRRLAQIDPTDADIERRVSELEEAAYTSAASALGEPEAPAGVALEADEPDETDLEDAEEPVREGPHDWWDDSAVDLPTEPAGAGAAGSGPGVDEFSDESALPPEDEVVEAILNGEATRTVRVEDTWWYEEAPEDDTPEPSTDADLLTRTMADLYAEQGLHREAAEIYEELLRNAPDDPDLLARLERVKTAMMPDRRIPREGARVDRSWMEVADGGPEPVGSPAGTPWLEELRGLLRAGEEKARSLPDPEPLAGSTEETPTPPEDGSSTGIGEAPADADAEDVSGPPGMSRFATEWLRGLEHEA